MKNNETTLEDLRPGAIFVTREGVYAVKSEYCYGNASQYLCILLESGEYAHFPDGNATIVCECKIDQ